MALYLRQKESEEWEAVQMNIHVLKQTPQLTKEEAAAAEKIIREAMKE
jgi:hypothetical protein